MDLRDKTVAVTLGFMPTSVGVPDPEHPGLLRAGPRASAPYDRGNIEGHVCQATDSCQDDAVQPDLLDFGFDRVDLSGFESVQSAFARVCAAGHVIDDEGATIRSSLEGTVLRTFSGHTLTVRHVRARASSCGRVGPTGCPLSTPHGACVLPGEDVAEQCYRLLQNAESAVSAGDVTALSEAASQVSPAVPTDVPAALRDAIAAMAAVADDARRDPTAVCGPRSEEWVTASRAAR
jgi:hypothetical protein